MLKDYIKNKIKINLLKIIHNNNLLFCSKLADLNYILFPKQLYIESKDKILIIAPHPDDESIGCGGLIIKFPFNCTVACVTDGSKSLTHIERKKRIAIRKKEFIDAMKFAGVKSYLFLSIKDGNVYFDFSELKRLNLRQFDHIFIPNPFDLHLDHKAITKALYYFLKDKQYKRTIYIYFYEVWNTIPILNCYLDISDVFKKKEELILRYESQVSTRYHERILSLNFFRGLLCGNEFVEGYTKLDLESFLFFSRELIL